jgi:hypothetical protein
MYKKVLDFIKYHNAFTIIFVMVFSGFGISYAASPAVRDSVYSSKETVVSVDNGLIVSAGLDDFNFNLRINSITDDGSSGRKGFVTELLREELGKNKNQEIFDCGPTPMLKSVIAVCNEFKVLAQVSFEEYMACGYGVCMSCVVKVNGKYIRTCVEGPVLRSDLVGV